MVRAAAAFLLALLLLPTSLMAQEAQQEEEPQPERWDDVTWYEVVHVKFKPGTKEDALELVKENYLPASRQAGTPTPTMVLDHRTGEWDLTVIWRMEGGPQDMTWRRSPQSIAFAGALREIAGGQEAMQELGERYQSYIQDAKSFLAFEEDVFAQSGQGGQ